MAQVQYIKDLYENEEKSLREISRITGHSFETVQKYAQKENWNEDNLPDTEPTSYPVLGEFIPIVDGWLEADRKVPRKQRHTAWRLFCRLRDEYGFIVTEQSIPWPSCANSSQYPEADTMPSFIAWASQKRMRLLRGSSHSSGNAASAPTATGGCGCG